MTRAEGHPFVLAVCAVLLATACAEPAPPPPKHLARPNRPPDLVRPKPAETTGAAFHSTAMTYEEALDVPEDLNAVKGARELSNRELTAPMQQATVIDPCDVPDATRVTVKVAVRDGKAMGVSVATRPDDPKVAECVDKAVRKLVWPSSKKRDSFTTVF